MRFSKHIQKIYSAYNLYDMYISLRRYDFVADVINNGHMEIKNSLVWK